MTGSTQEAPTREGRRFYSIQTREDGAVDVYLLPRVYPMTTEDGITDYDISVIVVRGVHPWDGIEEDIRARFQAWCESGEVIYL